MEPTTAKVTAAVEVIRKARMETLTPELRSAIAKKAAVARCAVIKKPKPEGE